MTIKDPVCGMEIDPATAFTTREHMGQTFYFCSASCAEQFVADPHKFALAGSATTGFNPSLPLASISLPILSLKKGNKVSALQNALLAVAGVRTATVNPASGIALVEYDPQVVTLPVLAAAVKTAGGRVGGAQTRIGIQDLRCASCVQFIEDELHATPGVLNASVNVGTQEATIEYLPEKTVLAQLNAAIEAWGYQARSAVSETPVDQQEESHAREYRRLMRKFWFAALISLPVLLFAYPQYVPVIRDLSMQTIRLAWVLSAVLTLPVLFWSGSDFFTGAWAALRHRSANMNTLIALGTAAAWLYSTVAVLFPSIFPEGTSEPFYDVVGVVIALSTTTKVS